VLSKANRKERIKMKSRQFVRVLGSADWCPTPGNDGASYTVDDNILIDTGWSGAVNLINHGIDPLRLATICFTHMHADHYMALPQFLLYWRIKTNSLEGLTIIGPARTVRLAFERALNYVFHDSSALDREIRGLPTILELCDGDIFETEDYRVRVIDSYHAVPGLCYRFEHKRIGNVIGFSGDTDYREAYGPFFKGCDLLIYESSFGAGPMNPEKNSICKHSSAQEAARVAAEAGVKRLLLTHSLVSRREESVAAAQAQLNIPVGWAVPYQIYEF
jgi:ribonuclease Z